MTMLLRLITVVPVILGSVYLLLRARARANAKEFQRLNPKVPVTIRAVDPFILRLLVTLKIFPKSLFVRLTGLPLDDFENKNEMFVDNPYGVNVSSTPLRLVVWVGDPALSKDITSHSSFFPKPVQMYGVLDLFGKNVVTVEGHEWRRHRKTVGPRFGEKNNLLVHDQTVRICKLMFNSWESKATSEEFEVNASTDMVRLALLVISSAGFGKPLPWEDKEGDELPNGHKLTFLEALDGAVHNLEVKLVTPNWALNLPVKKLQDTKVAFEEFESYLLELIRKPQSDDSLSESLLSGLINAHTEENDSESALTESEILGNTWIFMFAGHETTAGTLGYALALLALYPEKQRRLQEEVDRVLKGSDPTYKQGLELHYLLAIMNETLRLFPPVISIPKSTSDELYPLTSSAGEQITIPPSTFVMLNAVALHYSPLWGDDVKEFNPDRWVKKPSAAPLSTDTPSRPSTPSLPLDALIKPFPGSFIPFSEGPRACIGKRFSQTEFICILAMLASRYEWRIPGSRTQDDLLKSRSRLTLGPYEKVKILVKKRKEFYY